MQLLTCLSGCFSSIASSFTSRTSHLDAVLLCTLEGLLEHPLHVRLIVSIEVCAAVLL